jgi:transposase
MTLSSWTIFRHTKFLACEKRSMPAVRYFVILPQDSPELNPIEMPFSKLKAQLRKAAERIIPLLCRRIGLFARRFSASQALNYQAMPRKI